MTREEAIASLESIHDSFDRIHENTNCEIGHDEMVAIDMAIEALQWQDRILTQIEDIVLKEHGEKKDK